MARAPSPATAWRLCALTCLAMTLLSLLPQFHLWFVRGRNWNGTYATLQGDEFLYSAYVNALAQERPRRNDPFIGRDSVAQSPLPESSFSVQFIPAYLVAIPARVFGVSASTLFIVLLALAGLFSSLSLYWFLNQVTDDQRFAALGVVLVLCCGALAGGQGLAGLFFKHDRSAFMPFLRRYQPAAILPVFFCFGSFMWQTLTAPTRRRSLVASALAGLSMAVLVFSYLYLWTAAYAWFACVALLWLMLAVPAERWTRIVALAVTGVIAFASLLPYVILIAHRSSSLADAQILLRTHRPDVFHVPEVIGLAILLVIVMAIRRKRIKKGDPRVIFALSLSLLPFILFNQQVLTGRSMQPVHFDYYVTNYAVLISVVILASILARNISRRALLAIAALCFVWGLVEIGLVAMARAPSDVADDQVVPVLLRLKQLSRTDGTFDDLHTHGKTRARVFSPQVDVMRLLPTWSSQGTLLGAGALDFGSASDVERKNLLFTQLYYSGAAPQTFRSFLEQRGSQPYMNFYALSVMFGDERFLPIFSLRSDPIQPAEIDEAVAAYKLYVDAYSETNVLQYPLTYLVDCGNAASDLTRIDRWYRRDNAEEFGSCKLSRLTLRTGE